MKWQANYFLHTKRKVFFIIFQYIHIKQQNDCKSNDIWHTGKHPLTSDYFFPLWKFSFEEKKKWKHELYFVEEQKKELTLIRHNRYLTNEKKKKKNEKIYYIFFKKYNIFSYKSFRTAKYEKHFFKKIKSRTRNWK